LQLHSARRVVDLHGFETGDQTQPRATTTLGFGVAGKSRRRARRAVSLLIQTNTVFARRHNHETNGHARHGGDAVGFGRRLQLMQELVFQGLELRPT
jgi:hypothetical protein